MRNTPTFLAAALAFTALASPAAAQTAALNEAKAACLVGEQADGYIGVVSGASPSAEARRDMRDVNQRRKAHYEDLARRNGVTVQVAATLTAQQLINQAPPGHCVRDQSGRWIEK
jgi:uncharacterized protein YdbL (DUF1318 family)